MAQREPSNLAIVRQVPLFQKFNDAQLGQVCGMLKPRRYRKGEIIFHQGDEGAHVYLLCRGRVRIYLANADGREATVRIYRPYSAFGEIAVLDGAPRSASAAALADIETLSLHRDDFLGLLRQHFDLVLQMFALLTERLRYTTYYSERLAFMSGPARVAATLVQLANAEPLGAAPTRLDLTQQELAEFTNTTREWANRILHDFAAQGLIALERGAVVVRDREGLRALVG